MPYYLDTHTVRNPAQITIIGCGGTGGFVADALCRLLTGSSTKIMLVDHDRIEQHNLLRQNFYHSDLGHFKSQALAERMARLYRRTIGYSTYPFRMAADGSYTATARTSAQIVIGCVDNAATRRHMEEWLSQNPAAWLIDAGNDSTWGQVLIGNTTNPNLLTEAFRESQCFRVPAPTLQHPELLTREPPSQPQLDCAAAMDLTDQDPTINHLMASLVVQAVRRIIAGTCTYMGLYLDIVQGTLAPVSPTPAILVQIADRTPQPDTGNLAR